MTTNLQREKDTTVEKMMWDFETKFGNCFQPFGDKLDEAKDFIRQALQQQREERDREWRERIEGMKFSPYNTDEAWKYGYNSALSDLLTKEDK